MASSTKSAKTSYLQAKRKLTLAKRPREAKRAEWKLMLMVMLM